MVAPTIDIGGLGFGWTVATLGTVAGQQTRVLHIAIPVRQDCRSENLVALPRNSLYLVTFKRDGRSACRPAMFHSPVGAHRALRRCSMQVTKVRMGIPALVLPS